MTSIPFIEKVDRISQAFQVANCLALFLGEAISVLLYEVPPYLLWPFPFDATDDALG
jgi:hypothetical protein